MKKILLLLMVAMLSHHAYCQLNKSQWIAGVDAGFSSAGEIYGTSPNSLNATNFQVLPGAGYFFADKFCAGVRAGWFTANSKQYPEINLNGNIGPYYEQQKNTTFSAGLFARYYFLKKTSKINVLADVGYLYNFSTDTNIGGADPGGAGSVPPDYLYSIKTKSQFGSWTFAGGVAWFVSRKISLEFTTGFALQKSTSGNVQISGVTGFTFMGGLQFCLGR